MSLETQSGVHPVDILEKPKTSPAKKSKEVKATEKKQVALKKLEPETIKLLQTLREKANRKDFGRKVRDAEIIHQGLTLITQAHLEELKERTYTEQDRLRFAHLGYQKKHGKVSLDQFIGHLLKTQQGIENDTLANLDPKAN